MKLVLAQLHEGQNSFDYKSDKDGWLADVVKQIEQQGTRLNTPLSVQLQLTKLEPDYYLKGQMEFLVQLTCGRCTEAFSYPVRHGFELGLAHVKTSGEALSEESEELDIQYIEDNDLALAPIIEEQVYLSLPYAPVCRPDCKGICQSCGTDLNLGTCRCQKANPVNAFSKLSQYKC